MPLRLLGVFPRLEEAILLCGGTLARSADSQVETMVLSLAGSDGPIHELSRAARLLGVSQLVRLDFAEAFDGSSDDSLRSAINDLMRSFRPDVVVAAGPGHSGNEAAQAAIAAALLQAKPRECGSSPARLYWTSHPGDLACTTVVDVRQGMQRKLQAIGERRDSAHHPDLLDREFYVRAHPQPWVTGIIERDLFAGLAERNEVGTEPNLSAAA